MDKSRKRNKNMAIAGSSEEIVRKLEESFSSVDGVIEPTIISLIGKSGAGKTRALDEFCKRHPRVRTPDGLIAPILRVDAPMRATLKTLVWCMLQELESSASSRNSEDAMTVQLWALIQRANTRMVVIDDLHHLRNAKSVRDSDLVAAWLSALVRNCRVGLVVVDPLR